MREGEETDKLSRREVLNRAALIGLLAGAGGLAARKTAAQTTGKAPDYEVLKKLIIERLFNTRYYVAQDGTVVVLGGDEVWPGDSGGAYHADWLFNAVDGLKADPSAALEQTVLTDIQHDGIPPGWDLSEVQSVLDGAEAIGLLDDLNIAYQVLHEKIEIETEGAHWVGVERFKKWVAGSAAYTAEQKQLIEQAAVTYLDLPYAQFGHNWY